MRGNLQVQFGGRRASTLPYEYSDYNSGDEQSLTFDSYTIPEDDLELGQSRLLEVDNRAVLPAKSYIRFIVTSADVPHSWAVPSLGVKCDAVPGRLNQTSISVQREGVYYGQCSEICGTNHAFMPIVVEAVPRKDYGSRVENQLIPLNTDSSPLFLLSPNEPYIWGIPVVFRGERPFLLFPTLAFGQSQSSWAEYIGSSRSISADSGASSSGSTPSVNQPRPGDMPPAHPLASGEAEAGPSNRPPQVVSYPYRLDEVIGGDSVRSIQRRLLAAAGSTFPLYEEIRWAEDNAKDIFEAKVHIIQQMAHLDPAGDWLGRGACALENSRTKTGEEPYARLLQIGESLEREGTQSPFFHDLRGRVFLRR